VGEVAWPHASSHRAPTGTGVVRELLARIVQDRRGQNKCRGHGREREDQYRLIVWWEPNDITSATIHRITVQPPSRLIQKIVQWFDLPRRAAIAHGSM